MYKKRILLCGEASFLSTGFSAFNREILRRLHGTGKYEIAEMGSYAQGNCPEAQALPWKFYGVLPTNQKEKEIYESNPINQFGKYKIDAVLADYQPDICFSPLDPWMMEHLQSTRFRNNYKLFLMPTVDSAPQKAQWIEGLFKKADIITTYSRYGQKVLLEAGVDVKDVTSPGVNLDIWKPMDHDEIRDKFAIKSSLLIFGTVMRNQKRKLYPDLFNAYARLRQKWAVPQRIQRIKKKATRGDKLSKQEKKALRIQRSVLFCHTSWPDLGWNLPNLIQQYGIQRHTLFTYKCDACKYVYVSWFSPSNPRGITQCRKCGEMSAHMPGTHTGVDEQDLVELFNLIDIYVHPAICEGWGLPIMESKACGVPGLYQNYSAMEDHVQNGGGLPIKVQRPYLEAETEAIRTLPDIDDMVAKMEILAFDKKKRAVLAKQARNCAVRKHSWDTTCKKVEAIMSDIKILDRNTTWDKQPIFESVTSEQPDASLTNEQFIHWCYTKILKRPADQKGFNDWMATLTKGNTREGVEVFFRNQIMDRNKFEEVRWIKSCTYRGIEIKRPEINNDILPGILV